MAPIKIFFLFFSSVVLAQTDGGLGKSVPPGPGPGVGFSINSLDRSTDACVDFYQFACGGWMKQNPIPADQSRWGRFGELAERNREILHQILEKAAAADPKRSPLEQKYGDYYASCMDEQAVEAKGTAALKPEMDRIARVKDKNQLIDAIAHLHGISHGGGFGGGGGRPLFAFYATPDMHDARQMIANADQGGLGLPDRDYYLKDDPKSVETRNQYVEHVQKMLELLGDKPQAAARQAKAVMHIETELAKASMDRVMRRDPRNRDHKMKKQQLASIAPNLQLDRYLKDIGAPPFQELNVGNPDFFKQVNSTLKSNALEDWKAYLRWHLLRITAPALPSALVKENFRFTGQILTGQKELQARWKRCVIFTDRDLGEALGQAYVDAVFGVE
ncbi:MAG TPA: M13 family metallopeptidase N-terminal domain-containing protein, partial [Myxococcaceae bacterium]|nr:M13 family metallopeptidase N-terminal domain-containing protein [Myxococcaceae bacterium]